MKAEMTTRQERRARIRAEAREKIRRNILPAIMAAAAAVKPFESVHRFLPYRLRELARSWDYKMLRDFILSWGTRLYMDQNCVLDLPAHFKPLVEVKPEYRLTEQQIHSFYENGFLGPITLFTPEEMKFIRSEADKVLDRPSKVYTKIADTWRDRHIDSPEFWRIVSAPQIVERLAQLLGPNLQVWRSHVFLKKPGHPEVTWHQASTYLLERKFKPALEPAERNCLYQLTTWIAIDDADFENGCMHFLRGTHRKIWTMKFGTTKQHGEWNETAKLIRGTSTFAHQAIPFVLEIPMKPDLVTPMPLRAGQCVVFTERCLHGSPPNASDRRRFGLVFRTIKPDVRVYRDDREVPVAVMNQNYDLENWGCIQLRGEDPYRLNKMVAAPVIPKVEYAAATSSGQ